jgi:hypothetical protein
VFGVTRLEVNTEHSTFFKKSGTSDSNTTLFGIAIRSTTILLGFHEKKFSQN